MAKKNENLQKFQLLSVSINGKSHADHLGSGFFYRRSAGKPMLIITAAHVIEAAIKPETEDEIPLTIECCYDEADHIHPVRENFKLPGEFKSGDDGSRCVSIHPDYNKNSDNDEWNDIAIIQLPWEDWMKKIPFVYLEPDLPNEKTDLLCVGFPEASQGEFEKRQKLDQEDRDFSEGSDKNGKKLSQKKVDEFRRNAFFESMEEIHVNSNRVMSQETKFFPLKYEDITGNENSENEAIKGSSGSGIYINYAGCGNYRIYGLLKKLPEEDTRIRKLYAVRSSEIRKAIADYLGEESVPEFEVLDILEEMKEKYPCSANDWQIVEQAARDGIISKKRMIMEAKKGHSVYRLCREGNCGSCCNFVRGELAKYLCFLDKIDSAGRRDLVYEMEMSGPEFLGIKLPSRKQKVKIYLFCPKENEAEEKAYADFLRAQQRMNRKTKNRTDDKALFLWNRSGKNYNKFCEFPSSLNIVYGLQRKEFPSKREQVPLDKAVIGVGKMMDSVFPGGTADHGKKENLDRLMHKIWGE